MSFGPIMRFKANDLVIELAPLNRESLVEFINPGMQRHSITRYIGMDYAPVIENEQDWYDKVRTAKNMLVWGIWLIEGDKRTLLGNSALTDIERGHIRQATSGSMIFRSEYWGKGIASAAHKARTLYAFEQLGLHRIKSAVIQVNGGSRKALERSGYNLVYVERNTVFVDGQLRHQDNLECLNPNEPFWSQWFHGDRPTKAQRDARQRTLEALDWARQNVKLL